VTHHYDPDVLALSPVEVKAGMEAGTVLLLDVRSAALYERSGEHVPGDRRFPASPGPDDLASLDRRRLLVAYCDCPGEAGSFGFGTRLRRAGFPRTGVMVGGLAGWQAAGLGTEPVPNLDAGRGDREAGEGDRDAKEG
jgi:rhodanese-related sulfurtransferase